MKKAIVIGMTMVVLGGLAWSAWRLMAPLDAEPTYYGKPEGFWMQSLERPIPDYSRPQWTDPGSNLVPVLVKAVDLRNGPSRDGYRLLWRSLPGSVQARMPRQMNAAAIRTNAAALLAIQGDPGVLIRLLRNNRDASVRSWAARGLAFNAEKTVTSALVEALEDSSVKVRLDALLALGLAAREEAVVVPALLKKLQDSEPKVRFYAADALRGRPSGQEAGMAFLLRAQTDRDPVVRQMATSILREAPVRPSAD